MRHKITSVIKALCVASVVLAIVFLSAAATWILLTDRFFSEYLIVLSSILRNSGVHSTLLAAVVATVAFQSIKDADTKNKESEDKIKQIGQYTIAFQLEEKQGIPITTCGTIIVIENDNDYLLEYDDVINDESLIPFAIQFLTSSDISTNLQCIMAFGHDYFIENQKKIISNYYDYCEKQNLPNPLYCAARQTNPLLECEKRNRFVEIFIRVPQNICYKSIWISAITDQGVLLFIKVKLRLENFENKRYHCRLISQFSHSIENGKVNPLYY
ncbi:MAG: hypothetical protein FWC92_03060 [Defluviitaleaceae bacterium]|nr:hypothetical protein [Defluviitaleaceae bacterium]